MSDYISRKAIITWIEKSLAMYHDKYSTDMLHMFGLFRSAIEDKSLFPAADVVEVVRCRECKYNVNEPEAGNANCIILYGMTDQNGFCHYGERMNI